MKQTRVRIAGAILVCSWHICLQATVIVKGDDKNSPRGFTTNITTQVYDRKRGTFFVGLNDADDGAFTLSKAERPNFKSTPCFTGILQDSSMLLNATIEFLAFSQQEETKPILAAVAQEGGVANEAKKVFGLFSDGLSETQTKENGTDANLNDADGNETTGIVSIAASSSHIFAAVRPTSSSDFGQSDSGIALIELITSQEDPKLTLNIKDATTGLDGNKAVPLQFDSTVLKGDKPGTNDVIFTCTEVPMLYDEKLDRLYIGVTITTGPDDDDIGKAIVIGRIDECTGALILEKITPDSALQAAPVNEIVVAKNSAGNTTIPLSVLNIRTMHTSTGPDYLIINGGQFDCKNEANNKIRALPLVNNPANLSTHGTLAKKDAALVDFKFVTPATMPADLFIDNAILEPAAIVGAGDLPIQGDDAVSDMVVVGDTVYVSIGFLPTATNDTGIFYSQALFDKDGKILRWTPWAEKRVAPFNAFPGVTLPTNKTHCGNVLFFEVDATTGNIWIVEATTQRVVGITSWSKGTIDTDLTSKLNEVLCKGSYSVLDLHQATRGFLNETKHRYALFGGANKVVFARISQAHDITSLSSPQTVITDFSDKQDFLETELPKDAGCAQVLEYSRTNTTLGDNPNLNYFFAGTENGLFVFADKNGTGFNACTLNTLDQEPFNGLWHKIETISGSVVDIKTSGNGNLYVLTYEFAPKCKKEEPIITSTLYSIPFTNNIATMFAQGNIRTIAQTGIDIFEGIKEFFGIQIIATDDPTSTSVANKEQLVLATNQGLLRSNADQTANNGIQDALNQTQAQWQLIPTTDATMFNGIAGIETPIRHKVWPFSIQDEQWCKTFERGTIHQLSAHGNDDGTAACFNTTFPFIPEEFNAFPLTDPFKTLDPITFFFSDGGRRFFIFNRTQDPPCRNKIGVIPFCVEEWSVMRPRVLIHPVLDTIGRFYWVNSIGMSGLLMAGTGTGVVALE